jgi:predicted peptidase
LPLLCFLHGYGEAAPLAPDIALRRHGPLARSSASLARDEFIVVAPQLPFAGDTWHRYADEVLSVLDEVAAKQPIDAARRYLTGFSFGGNGVFDLALLQPEAWAALWAVDPTRVPREPPRQPVWISAGAVARSQRSEFVRSLALRPQGERVWADDGEDHVGSARVAYGDERVYRWLLAFSS